MKKCFKLLGIALFATTLCFSMASCGDKEETSTEQGSGGDPDPGPGPGPGPDPQDNPFEGMAEGTVKMNFNGQDVEMEYLVFKYYAEIAGSGGTWALNCHGAKADAGNGRITLPAFRIVANLTGEQTGLNPYANWVLTTPNQSNGQLVNDGWYSLVVSYQDGTKDTFDVGDYFYNHTNITVTNFNYQGFQKKLTAKIVVPMVNFDEATSGATNPQVYNATFYFYRVVTDDAYPQSKSLSDKKGVNPAVKPNNKIPVSYSRL